MYSCNNITMTLIQISRLFNFGFFSKTNHQMMIWSTPIVSRSKRKCYKSQKVHKWALNSQLQALQTLTNDDEFENWRLSSFFLAVRNRWFGFFIIFHFCLASLALQTENQQHVFAFVNFENGKWDEKLINLKCLKTFQIHNIYS